MAKWIGIDFDGTLAEYTNWVSPSHVGKPIQPMVDLAKAEWAKGFEIRIFTARMYPFAGVIRTREEAETLRQRSELTARRKSAVESVLAIQRWCNEVFGYILPITNVKDQEMVALYDDRAFRVEKNTGKLL